MKFYVACKDKRINKTIEEDLNKIKKVILHEFPDTKAIILEGSFGRGEGNVITKDGIIKPINDYDLVMVTNERVNLQKLKNLEEILTRAANNRLKEYYFYVGIRNMTTKESKKLPCTMQNYDLKYAPSVLYGEKEILQRIPEMSVKEIPLLSGQKPLFLFLRNFLCSFSMDYLQRPPSHKENFWLMFSSAKLIIADITSLLILKGEYHPSYRERLKNFLKIYPENRKLCDMAQEAINFKLMPIEHINKDVINFWFKAKETHFEVLFYFMQELYGRKFNDVTEILKLYKRYNWARGEADKPSIKIQAKKFLDFLNTRKVLGMYRIVKCFIKRTNKEYKKRINLDSAALLLLASIKKEGIDQNLVKAASKELRINSDEWECAQNRYMEMEEPHYKRLK